MDSCLENRAHEVTLPNHNQEAFDYKIRDVRASIVMESEWSTYKKLRSVLVHFPAKVLFLWFWKVLDMLHDDLLQEHLP